MNRYRTSLDISRSRTAVVGSELNEMLGCYGGYTEAVLCAAR